MNEDVDALSSKYVELGLLQDDYASDVVHCTAARKAEAKALVQENDTTKELKREIKYPRIEWQNLKQMQRL